MSIFGKLGSAPAPFAKGQYPRDGKYLVEIRKVSSGESQKGDGPYVAVEYAILQVLVGYDKSNAVGESVSWVVMLSKKPAMSNLKGFFGAACGIHPDARFAEHPTTRALVQVNPGDTFPDGHNDVSDREWEKAADAAVAGAGDALAGTALIADAMTVATKKAGGLYTRVAWSEPD